MTVPANRTWRMSRAPVEKRGPRSRRDLSPDSPEHAPPESPVLQEQHPLAESQPGTRLVYAQASAAGNQAVAGAGTPAVAAMTDSGHVRSWVTWQRLLQG